MTVLAELAAELGAELDDAEAGPRLVVRCTAAGCWSYVVATVTPARWHPAGYRRLLLAARWVRVGPRRWRCPVHGAAGA